MTTFALDSTEVVAILGANGAGKSTLLTAIAGEIGFTGEILVDGKHLKQLDAAQQSRVRAVLPQKPGLDFPLSVEQIVVMGAYPFSEFSSAQVELWVVQALQEVDLLSARHQIYPQLSGGEQQRVQCARILVQCRAIAALQGHAYLLLDEPFSSLDPRHQHQLFRTIVALAHQEQVGVLVVMHDMNLAAQCDRVVLMDNGTLFAQGTPAEVLTTSNLCQVFAMDLVVIPHPLHAGKLLILP